jgi:NAD(P)-dependent dehydrogenase (short-subunit alcohol dehydrogenase family)
LKGEAKKIIAISSGASDLDMTRKYDVFFHSPYAISKAALNSVVSKFSAQYRKDGVLFLAVCPGMADTGGQFARKCGIHECSTLWCLTT